MMMRTDVLRKICLGGAALGIGVLTTSSADAYCRQTTGTSVSYDPVAAGSCSSSGAPLFLRAQCFPYRLLAKESAIIPNAVLSDKLAKAFAVWSAPNPNCTPGIQGIELTPTEATTIVSFVKGDTNENVIGVPDTWKHPADMLVVPTITYDDTTGEILDVDLEVNPNVAWALADPVPASGIDLQAAITHAVGHVLGLASSSVPASAMFESHDPGATTQRTLDTDDEQAICSVYPNRSQRNVLDGTIAAAACNLSPSTGSSGCGEPEVLHGCSTSPLRGTGSASCVVLGVVALTGFARARRRTRAHRRSGS